MDSHIVSHDRFWFVVIFFIGFFPASGLAAGFYITEIGTPGSLGTAGAANPTNTFHADSSWTNPAGMTGLDKDVMVAGLQLVVPKIEFDPSVTEGGGVSALYTQYAISIAFNSAAIIPGASDAKFKVENATDWGFQPFVGLTYQLTDEALLGIVYRAESDIDLNGDLNIRNWSLPTPVPGLNEVDISWDNPQWLDVGLRYTFRDTYTVFLNGGWQEWSEFSDNGIEITGGGGDIDTEIDREWDNTWYARIGFAHDLGDQTAYTLGFSYDSSPVNDNHRSFDLPVDAYYKLSAAYMPGRVRVGLIMRSARRC